jgi:uncharacterized protein YdbL (DUF1318 family)
MANPFYVEPGNNFLPGLSMLNQGVQQYGAKKKEDELKAKFETIKQGALQAYQSGDPDQMAEFALKNPEISQALMGMMQFKNNITKDNYIDSVYGFLADPTEENLIKQQEKRLKVLESQGQTNTTETTAIIDKFRQNPEQVVNQLKMTVAPLDPKRWEAFQSTVSGGEKPTDAIKNYEYYKTLLRENPSEADKFANQTGINKDERTTAIKEFEYAEKNPEFALKQKKDLDDQMTKDKKKQSYADSTSLRKEFLDQSKDYQTVRDSYTRIVNSTKEVSPAGDLALIFNYMKMLDPGSVVRESEFATAASTGSYGQRIQAAVQKVMSGERLAPEMRADFISKAADLYKGMEDQHQKRSSEYRKIAEKNGLPIDEVIIDITKTNFLDTLPEGSRKIGTKDGKNVYQSPDGKKYIEE